MVKRNPPRAARSLGRPTAAEAEEKRLAILRVATELFLAHGYREVTTRMVAEGANVSRQTLFNLFKDKALLFQACLDFATPVYPSSAINDDEPPALALRAFGVELVRWMYRERSVGFSRLVMIDGRNIPELAAVAAQNNETHFIRPLARYLTKAGLETEGETRNARLFINMAISQWLSQLAFGEAMQPQTLEETARHIDNVTNIFLNGAALVPERAGAAAPRIVRADDVAPSGGP